MRSTVLIAPIAAASLLATVGAGQSTRAANINDLRDTYIGAAHHNTVADDEDRFLVFEIEQTQETGGKFSGSFGEVPVSGKVTNTGKVTFSGGDSSTKIKQGKAQLSANGRFMVGSFTAVGGSGSGKYTFSVDGALN